MTDPRCFRQLDLVDELLAVDPTCVQSVALARRLALQVPDLDAWPNVARVVHTAMVGVLPREPENRLDGAFRFLRAVPPVHDRKPW